MQSSQPIDIATISVALLPPKAEKEAVILLRNACFNSIEYPDNCSFLTSFSKSWISIPKSIPSGEVIETCWIDFIYPSLKEYFNQIEMTLLNPGYKPNFMLCIDSLSIKIEGMLRDIMKLKEEPTIKQVRDEHGRLVDREKDINDLLHEETIKEMIGEDDLLFLQFVFIEKAGLNFYGSIMLLPYWLAIEMNWDFAIPPQFG